MTLRSPLGETVTRDIADGLWEESSGDPDEHLGEESWALPGLVDAHAHLAAEGLAEPGSLDGAIDRARQSLDAGLMLILDKGWGDFNTIQVVEALSEADRPDIEAAARIIAVEGGYFPDFARDVDPAGLASAVIEEARSGRGWVKLIGDWPRRGQGPVTNFGADQLAQAVSIAESEGARVAVHAMAREAPSLAVAAGVHSIEHGLFLSEDDVGSLGGRGGMWVPTILRVEETVRQLGESSSGGRLLLEGLDNVRRLLPLAVEAGVHILAGTDLVGSPSNVAAEAIKLAGYGLTKRQAVMSVAGSGFIATGRPASFDVGSPANAVLFSEDPTTDLGVLSHPELIVRLGVVR